MSGERLPETGSSDNAPLAAGGAGLVVIGAALLASSTRFQHHDPAAGEN